MISALNSSSPTVNNYTSIQPLMAAMKGNNDQLPKNTLPENTLGTIQENAHSLPTIITYNAHGILNTSNPNSLIAIV